jgi:hypothetical protein
MFKVVRADYAEQTPDTTNLDTVQQNPTWLWEYIVPVYFRCRSRIHCAYTP